MTQRFTYIDNSPTTTIQGAGVSGTGLTFDVDSLIGYPTIFPYHATLDLGSSVAEQIIVTAASGSTVTCTRNANGLGAYPHPAGATFDHTLVAEDLDDANLHITSTSAVHGVAGNLVGTTDTQTLTGKTITGAVYVGPLDTTLRTGDPNGIQVTGTDAVVKFAVSPAGNVAVAGSTALAGALTVTGAASAASVSTPRVTVQGTTVPSTGADPLVGDTVFQGRAQPGNTTSNLTSGGDLAVGRVTARIVPPAFPDTATRDAFYAAPVTIAVNEMCYVAGFTQLWNGSAWIGRTAEAGVCYGEVAAAASPTSLGVIGQVYAPGGTAVTFTLAVQRRVRVYVESAVTQSANTGDYRLQAAYNTGGTLSTAAAVLLGVNGERLQNTMDTLFVLSTEFSVVLTPGQYTFYPAVKRLSGGLNTDTCTYGHVAVYDAGPS